LTKESAAVRRRPGKEVYKILNYVYIAECADGTLYTGYTVELKNRAKAHNTGKGAKYTKSRRPVKIVYSEEFATRSEALRREAAIKKLSRREKWKLINTRPRV
jgi:putative endonuclease